MLFVYDFVVICTGSSVELHTIEYLLMTTYMRCVSTTTTYKRRPQNMVYPVLDKHHSRFYKRGWIPTLTRGDPRTDHIHSNTIVRNIENIQVLT